MTDKAVVPAKRRMSDSDEEPRQAKKTAHTHGTRNGGASRRVQAPPAGLGSKMKAGRQKKSKVRVPTRSSVSVDGEREGIEAPVSSAPQLEDVGTQAPFETAAQAPFETADEIQPVRVAPDRGAASGRTSPSMRGAEPVAENPRPSPSVRRPSNMNVHQASPPPHPRPLINPRPAGREAPHAAGSDVERQSPSVPVPMDPQNRGARNGVRLVQLVSRAMNRIDAVDGNMLRVTKDISDLEGEVAGVKSGMNVMTKILDEMNGKMTKMVDADPSESTGSRPAALKKENGVKPMIRYEKIMARRVPFHEVAFDGYVLSRCTISSIFAEIADRCDKEHLDPAGLKTILSAVFFSLKRTDRKNVYDTPGGKAASTLRRRILLNVLRQSRLDTFRRFRSNPDDTHSTNVVHSQGGLAAAESGRPLKPSWLQSSANGGTNYLTQDHLRLSQEHQESSSAEKSTYQRRLSISGGARPSRADDGEFAMSHLYSSLLTTLNASRRCGPLEFFQRVGYLFVDWKPHSGCRVGRDDLKMWWVVDVEKARPCVNDDIPKAIAVSAGDPLANEKNEDMYKAFVEEREEMQILVHHDVVVRLKGKEDDIRNHIGVDTRQWTRIISLIDVAAHFLRAACSFGKGVRCHELLLFNSKSILALYNIAWVFRGMIASRRDPQVLPPASSTERQAPDVQDIIHASDDESADITQLFDMLTPSPSMLNRALVRMTCAVPEETYDAEHIDPSGNGANSNTPLDGHDDDTNGNGMWEEDAVTGDSDDEGCLGDM